MKVTTIFCIWLTWTLMNTNSYSSPNFKQTSFITAGLSFNLRGCWMMVIWMNPLGYYTAINHINNNNRLHPLPQPSWPALSIIKQIKNGPFLEKKPLVCSYYPEQRQQIWLHCNDLRNHSGWKTATSQLERLQSQKSNPDNEATVSISEATTGTVKYLLRYAIWRKMKTDDSEMQKNTLNNKHFCRLSRTTNKLLRAFNSTQRA